MLRVPRSLLAGLIALTAIRLVIAANLPLGDDETFYWEWSRHLAAGYVDHPPAIAYLVWAAVRIFGRDPLAVHAVAIVLSFATSLALWTLAREVLGRDDAATWSVILLNVIPVFAVGSVFTAPDGPLGLCWVLTLLYAWRAAQDRGGRSWVAAGAWVGLGLESKYVAAFLPLSLGAWLALSPAHRRWLRRPEPYFGLGLALAVFAPVVWWNATHRWVSFAFAAQQAPGWSVGGNLPVFVALQFAYLAPVMFPALIWALGIAARRGLGPGDGRWLFLAGTGWPLILGMLAASVMGQAKGHWTAPGYLPGIIALAGIATERPWPNRSRAWRVTAAVTLGTTAFLAACIHALPFLTAYLLPPRLDPTVDYYGWPRAGPEIVALARRDARGPFFITTDRYQIMAQFDFTTGGLVTATTVRAGDQYQLWTRLSDLRGWDGLFIKDSRYPLDVDLAQGCRSIDAEAGIPLVRRGIAVRTLELMWCRHFLGRALPALAPNHGGANAGGSGGRVTRAWSPRGRAGARPHRGSE